MCGSDLGQRSGTGRPRLYCGTPCRQRALRDRRAEIGNQLAELRRRVEEIELREGRREGRVRKLDQETVKRLRAAFSGQERR